MLSWTRFSKGISLEFVERAMKSDFDAIIRDEATNVPKEMESS